MQLRTFCGEYHVIMGKFAEVTVIKFLGKVWRCGYAQLHARVHESNSEPKTTALAAHRDQEVTHEYINTC